jgi:hypothetical protein
VPKLIKSLVESRFSLAFSEFTWSRRDLRKVAFPSTPATKTCRRGPGEEKDP